MAISANRLELLQIADAVAREKSIDRRIVITAMEDAIAKAARSRYGSETEVRAEINPKTGEIKVQKTPTERANPYGMVFTTNGTPFVCDFGTNKIIEINSETLAIKEYELPNSESRPRRIAISPDDIIWYADYSRGYLGRLDPKTGKVTDWPSPSGPRSQPYGITYLNGAIWYVESAIRPNVLVRFDIKTEKFQSWTIPGGGGVVRNMKATRDGNLVIAESGVNKVGLVLVGSK